MPFQQFALPSSLVRNLQALGYVTPTPIQTQAIPVVRSGRDLVATAQTGSGKTAAFLLPVLHQLLDRPRGGTGALVLAPTRELAQQIVSVFRGLVAGTPLRAALVVGGAPQPPQEQALRAGIDLVVATPGRLLAILREGKVTLGKLHTLVLDEADQMFDLGFFPDLKQIIARLPARRQTLLFSATMPAEVVKLTRTILHDPVNVAVGAQGTPVSSVTQTVYPVRAHRKMALLEHLLESFEMPSVLVFTRTRRGARRLTRNLESAGHPVAELHGNRSPAQRARAMQGFRAGKIPLLVATNIAARGIDVRHVSHVVNFDVPDSPDEYVHRIGRTGRAGDTGDALVFAAPEESGLLARIERQIGKRLPRKHLANFDYDAPAVAASRTDHRGPSRAASTRGRRAPQSRRG